MGGGIGNLITNQETKYAVPPLMVVRVLNSTSNLQAVEVVYGKKDRRQNTLDVGKSHSHSVDIHAGVSSDVVIPSLVHKKIKVDPSTVTLRPLEAGVRWKGHDDLTASPPKGGCELILELDEACPPLSKKDVVLLTGLVQDLVEGASVGPPPSRAENNAGIPEVWRYVVGQLGRNGKDDRVVRGTRDMIFNACGNGMDPHRHWGITYDRHPRRPTVSKSIPNCSSLLREGKYSIEVYHRAMDRFPGGDEDIHVIRQIFSPSTGGMQLSIFVFRISNQNATIYTKPQQRELAMVQRFADKVPSAILSVIDGKTGQDADIECTIDDPRVDYECEDTEWSSIEIMVKDTNGALAARIHQRARLPNDAYIDQKVMPPPSKPSVAVQGVLNAVEEACGMGTVQQWSKGSRKALANADVHQWDYQPGSGVCGFTPIYFNST